MKITASLAILIVFCQIVTSQEWCPKDCNCLILNGTRARNHAKCSGIEGLLEGGKDIPLHSIDLSNIQLTKISHFEKLRVLSSIDLSYNNLVNIDHLGRRVKSLNLKHNQITSPKLINIPKYVENLDLSYNKITYLPLEITKLRNLKSFELIGNKINCTCETIEIRNWLQSKHIWTENPIKCAYPSNVKDLPWLQVKQSDICETGNNVENYMMLSDQPAVNEGSAEKESAEELGKDFLLVDHKLSKIQNKADDDLDGDEGSGDGPKMANFMTGMENDTEIDNEGSSSGMGMLVIPHILIDNDDQYENNDTGIIFDTARHRNEEINPLSSPYDEATTSMPDIFGAGVLSEIDSQAESDNNMLDMAKDPIVPSIMQETQAEIKKQNEGPDSNEPLNANIQMDIGQVNRADSGDNKGTYILLGVIVIIVIALILFVAFKRFKNGRTTRFDPENLRGTELADMDKKYLGKPIQKQSNGNYEQKPLIGLKGKEDLATPINGNNRKLNNTETDSSTKKPLLDDTQNQNSLKPESNNNVPTQQPIVTDQNPVLETPNTPPKSPSAHSARYGGYPPPKSPRSNVSPTSPNTDDGGFLPSSPKQGRYSPVYSPETGKVKIKLLETPKPKTPKIVSKNRSNADELTTTPTNENSAKNN